MALFTIYSSDGQTARYSGKPKYNGTYGNPSFLEFDTISSPSPINLGVGDYVDYTGGGRTGYRYYLYSIPQPTKQATADSCGDAFVYKNVQFFCKTKDLEITLFRDIVTNGAAHFSTTEGVSTYENVAGIASRINANLDLAYGSGVWNVAVYSGDAAVTAKMNEVKEFSVSDGSCLDALNQIYTTWQGIGWVYSVVNGVHTITLGRPNARSADNTSSIFSYGKGNGLKVIAKNVSTKNDVATRLFVYGSERNLPTRWYANLSPSIYDAGSMNIQHLMIPPEHWGLTQGARDARKAFLDADAAAKANLGLIAKTVRFDGSGDYEEIYPSLEGMTIGDVKAGMSSSDKYYPKSIYSNNARVDGVKSVVNPTDNGITNTDGSKYTSVYTPSWSSSTSSQTRREKVKTLGVSWTNMSLGNISASSNVTLDASGVEFVVDDLPPASLASAEGHWWVSLGGSKIAEGSMLINTRDYDSGQEQIQCTIPVSTFPVETDTTKACIINVVVALKFTDTAAASTGVYTCQRNVYSDPIVGFSNTNLPSTFTMTLKQIGFDISTQYTTDSDGYGTIEMKTGNCAGRSFVIQKCEYMEENSLGYTVDEWVLTLKRQEDTSVGMVYPNASYTISAEDKFVLTGIMMPDLYVETAMDKLYARGLETLATMSQPKMVYTPEIDAKVLAESGERLVEGMYMQIYDTDIISGNTAYILIDSITINEGESNIPTYSVTLRDEKYVSMIDRIQGENANNAKRVSSLESKGKSVSAGNDGSRLQVGEQGVGTQVTSTGVRIGSTTTTATSAELNSSGVRAGDFYGVMSSLQGMKMELVSEYPDELEENTVYLKFPE